MTCIFIDSALAGGTAEGCFQASHAGSIPVARSTRRSRSGSC
jgi:hypothetical protein